MNNKIFRLFLTVFAFLLAVGFLVYFFMLVSDNVLRGMIEVIVDTTRKQPYRTIAIIVSLVFFLVSMAVMLVAIISGRMRRQRVRSNEIGDIDIGVGAIESIAMNAAKASQSGVKAAKVTITPYKNNKISATMRVVTFPDVELPRMMAKVQERVKKDIEKYTGIEVADVKVRVAQVESIAARIER